MVEGWSLELALGNLRRRRVLTDDAECGIILTSFYIIKEISNGGTYI